jgi:hypothetical protein
MKCPCGIDVGTEISECYTAYELHLVPDLVRAREQDRAPRRR